MKTEIEKYIEKQIEENRVCLVESDIGEFDWNIINERLCIYSTILTKIKTLTQSNTPEASLFKADELLKKYEDENEFHFHESERKWLIQAMNEYKGGTPEARKVDIDELHEKYGAETCTDENRISFFKWLKQTYPNGITTSEKVEVKKEEKPICKNHGENWYSNSNEDKFCVKCDEQIK